MRSRTALMVVASVVLTTTAERGRAADEDPVIGGNKLSELVAAFKAAKTGNERSNIAFDIAAGKEKAASAVPVLVAALNDKEPFVRANLIAALGSMGPAAKGAVPNLMEALKDDHPAIRISTMHSLARIGPDAKAAVPLICNVLKDPEQKPDARAAAAHALGVFGGDAKAAVPLLTDALKDKDPGLRVEAARALFTFDKENAKLVMPVLRGLLKDKDERTRTHAVMGLQEFGASAKDAIPELIALLPDRGAPGYYSRELLGKIPAAELALVMALQDPDKQIQAGAREVLKKHFPETAKKAGLIK